MSADVQILIPPRAKLDQDNSVRVTAALSTFLKRLSDKGEIPAGITYQYLIAHPVAMQLFITKCKENRDLAGDIAVDPAGQAVADDNTRLVCGLTLAQVERMVVIACATKVFATKGKESKGALPEQLSSYLAFDWQLPLLESFAGNMAAYQLRELGEGVVMFKTPAMIKAIGAVDAADIRKARATVGDRYMEMMAENPLALRGIANCESQKQFEVFAKLTGKRVWSFFGGNQQQVVELLGFESTRLLALGPHFPDISVTALGMIEELPTKTLTPFINSFFKVFGEPGRALLRDDQFADKFFHKVVGEFRGMAAKTSEDIEMIANAAVLKWGSIKPKVIDWIKATKQK